MEYFSSFIDYVASSEWTAYLENIDNSYKHELNNVKRIKFLKEKYPYIQIKKFIYFNIQSGNYLLIYYNIENYINRRGGKMILFNTPSIRDIKHKNFFEQVMEKMCTDIVYKSYGKEVIDGEVFFESFKKPYFFDITRKNKSL